MKAGGSSKHIDLILMGFVYLSCSGYFENTHKYVLYYCTSGRETLRVMLIAFSKHPAPLAETAPAAFQFLTKTAEFAGPHLSGISASTAVLIKLCAAPNMFRCYTSNCYAGDGSCRARLTVCRVWSASEWVCAASVCMCWVLLKTHSSSWKAFPYPEQQLDWAHAEQTCPTLYVFTSYLQLSSHYNIKWSNNSNCVVLFASPEHLLSISSTAWKSIILVYSLSCSNSIRNTSHQYAPSWEKTHCRCVSWLQLYSQARTHLVSAHHNCKSV